ncbi:MAG: excinuclease ABC subunit UvrC [Deltaproteobacteria bacterium]|nr:excinuclease ABC subunit UvrC [Deltaproteobacteria bacterium]MBW1953220.1 excinuclease ABC subunit UvrC [Deltaproteobacteria bacterium]MBW1985679.1 excinuclease ABC subunit UvrC [Deltaproteobacteria bacterium]MBW2134592.1 excinuclease ABC subunit UvrC [Deltaproteobacteria bacterium]
MSKAETLSPALAAALPQIPTSCGVYLFKDKSGRVLYVGKAVNLKHRLSSYLKARGQPDPKTALMLQKMAQVDFLLTPTEVEALILERNLIKEHRPRFNVVLRDDKNYLCIRLDLREPFPRLALVRRFATDGACYFGPFVSAVAIREILRIMKRAFRLRTCKDKGIPKRSRPCLNYQLGRCLAPCVGLVSEAEYRQAVQEALWFLQGQNKKLRRQLRAQMEAAAAHLNFEQAAIHRDRLAAINRLLERQSIATSSFKDQDVLGLAREGDQFLVLLLFVRGGMVTGSLTYDFTQPGTDDAQLLEAFLKQYYTPGRPVPEEILLPLPLKDQQVLGKLLREQQRSPIRILAARKGHRSRLLSLAADNARAALKARLEAGVRANPLVELQQRLQLPRLPQRLEGLDISTLQGSQPVGALVTFRDGQPDKSGYRRFRIRQVEGQNDFAMLAEVVHRHYGRAGQQLPDLLVIDGGRGQLAVVVKTLEDLGLAAEIPVVGLAKAGISPSGKVVRDRLYLPGRKNPLFLPPGSPGQLLLMHLRDEAHRFAISYHRQQSRQEALRSALSQIPGIGPQRQKSLLSRFSDLTALQQASLDELLAVPGLTRPAAQALLDYFNREKQEAPGPQSVPV